MDLKVSISFTFLLFLSFVSENNAWSGNVCSRQAAYWANRPYCICRYWWGCSVWRDSWYLFYYTEQYCCPGWRHNGNYDCSIPICYPTCKNGGTCSYPNTCACTSGYTGLTCQNPKCSYLYPCYPGDCTDPYNCTCFKGFGTSSSPSGCKDIISNEEKPRLGKVIAKLANLKRIANAPDELKYEFITDATNKNETEMIWSNQNPFNLLEFEFESIYMNPDGFPKQRPVYVHEYGIGIVKGSIHVNLTKIPRNDGPIRDVHLNQTYNCSGFSYLTPILDTAAQCNIRDDQFSRLISNGDWFTVTFQAENGGFRSRLNTDSGTFLPNDIIIGQIEKKRVEFRFDFEAAIHCSENNGTCQEKPLAIAEDITKKQIGISWGGWSDALAGMWQYYLEIFKLSPDPYGRLVEIEPLKPIHTRFINETDPHYANYTPKEPGMYSVLLEARDMANNSKIARRLCLYDNISKVEIDTTGEHKIYISTATSASGYLWQASPDVITVVWSGHFFNKIHRENKLLNQVLKYPIQFAEVEEDGILSSRKYVFNGLDDGEGRRSISEITNFNGIVRFEVNEDLTDSVDLPNTSWKDVSPLAENYTFQAKLFNGRKMKVWVRAHDIMGNSAYDFAELKLDSSPPVVGPQTFQRNYQNGTYKYCSRFTFTATDDDSGVHTLEYKLVINNTVKYTGQVLANFNKYSCGIDPDCRCKDNICFKGNQVLDIDNCWFLTKANLLILETVTVQVFVQNQAFMSANFSQEVKELYKLNGLTETSGPKNIKKSNEQTNGVRLNWELPESCYGETDIVIEIVETGTKYRVTKDSTFIDVLGLEEGKAYTARFSMMYRNEDLGVSIHYPFITEKTNNSALIGGIVGGVLGFLVIIAILIGIIIILLRRGRAPKPIQKKYNEFSVRRRERRSMAAANKSYGVDNRAMSELYLYGGMAFESEQAWHLSRDDITFESLIKQGHFANIYKATMHHGTKSQEYVVAKTLKETHTDNDLQLMKAKINFLGTKVGNHPNILKFVGAVLSDDTIGPFIVHEYCENGTLKEYLEKNKNNVTVELQELLFRFGLDTAKGMEFLANKGIVHRRLAARNILLNFLNEVKITGFGPQPTESADDGDAEAGPSGKRERIPIKWMAPECMESTVGATQKSDVWSYGVVLWEIFSLGETPYSNIRSRDLPSRIKKGERLPKPEQCDDTWYNVMKKIWNYDPKKRPTFTEIRDELDQMFVTSGDDYYYYKR